jgi:SAM-dependent methyltransferase
MTQSDNTDELYNDLHRDAFRQVLQGSDNSLPPYVQDSVVRLHRVVANMLSIKDSLKGPTLDVASGYGILYRVVKEYFPEMLPYSVAELKHQEISIDGDSIDCHEFHCDRDRLPLKDGSVGTILFCDVIEHLIVDPMWTLLEFNRVLRPGGQIIISTPNAAAIVRAFYILGGVNPGREIEYKPTSVYQRHNREWSVSELQIALRCSGFDNCTFTTHTHLIDPDEHRLLAFRENLGIRNFQKESHYGPEIFMAAEKTSEVTLDMELPDELRWPDALYGTSKVYKKRPKVFPIVIGDDYS